MAVGPASKGRQEIAQGAEQSKPKAVCASTDCSSATQNPPRHLGNISREVKGVHNVTHNIIHYLREGRKNWLTAKSEKVSFAGDGRTSAARRALKAASLC